MFLTTRLGARWSLSYLVDGFAQIRVAKFPGILITVNFHREFWGDIGNFGKFSETLEIFKISMV